MSYTEVILIYIFWCFIEKFVFSLQICWECVQTMRKVASLPLETQVSFPFSFLGLYHPLGVQRWLTCPKGQKIYMLMYVINSCILALYLYESERVGLTPGETSGRIFIADKTTQANLFVSASKSGVLKCQILSANRIIQWILGATFP